MNERGIVGFLGLGAIVALLGFLFGGAPSPAPTPSPRPSPSLATSPQPLPPGVANGRGLLEAFFSDGHEASLQTARERYELRVLIATLPDPVDTHLDWLFDSNLDALKRAFESAGYVIDRFWLPWGRDDRPAQPFASPGPRAEEWPGVLLFRKTEKADPKGVLGLLYVVGESPTSGVHKAALRVALEERYELLTTVFSPPDPKAGSSGQEWDATKVRMVAPVFSGSAASLVTVLDGFGPSHEATFELRSGTATAPASRTLLHAPNQRHFAATIHSDASLLKVLCDRVVKPLGLRDDQVAVLKEATTQYGQSRDVTWGCGDNGFLVLPFPMNISGLRTAYPAAPTAAASKDKGAVAGAEPPRLPLNLTDPLRPRESLPAFSDLTPPSIDIEFDALARVVSHQDVRLVCILATDVRDTLFLGSELRRRTRDVQLVTLESNDLYLRPEYGDALRGMIVLSTYPLLEPEARHERGQRLAFTNGGAQGTFNATLSLLDPKGGLVDYAGPRGEQEARPPVWVTVVGEGGMLPLATGSVQDDLVLAWRRGGEEGSDRPAASWAGRRLEPVGFGMIVLLGIVGILLLVVAPSLGRPPDVEPPTPPPKTASYAELRDYMERLSLVLHPHIYAALALLALAGLYLPLALLVVRRQGQVLPALFGGLVGVCPIYFFARRAAQAATLAFETSGVGLHFALVTRWPTPRKQLLWGFEVAARVAVSLAGILYAGLLVWLLAWILRLRPASFRFFATRALQLDGGVSPLLPLACGALGFATWSVWHLLRIRALADRGDYELCLAASSTDTPEGDQAGAVRERLFLAVPAVSGIGVLVGLVLVAFWIASGFTGTLESIVRGRRPTPFDLLLPAVVMAGVCTTAWAVFRLLFAWRALRRYLDALGQTPLVPAFARLPAALPKLARLTPWSDARAAIRSMAATQLRALRRLYPKGDGRLASLLRGGPGRHLALAMKGGDSRAALAAVRNALEALWRFAPDKDERARLESALDKAGKETATSDDAQVALTGPLGLWQRAAEEYVAVQAAGYIESVLWHLRVLAAFLLISLLVTTVMLSSYPFQPQGLAKLTFSFVLAGAVLALVVVISDMNRNDLLSRLSRTPPGKLTWDLGYLLNLALFALAPLLTLVGSELPWFRGVFFAWVDPLLRALTKS